MAQHRSFSLDKASWFWKQRDTSKPIDVDISTPLPSTASASPGSISTLQSAWHPVTSMPTNIHVDLMAAGVIPDPFVSTNEKDLQWIGETDWLYRCTFDVSGEGQSGEDDAWVGEGEIVELVCDGLDTDATVYLNGKEIMKADNMFIQHRTEVTAHLGSKALKRNFRKQNDLCILFASAYNLGKDLERIHGTRSVWNGDASRVYVRKAQYHWGWDWGPVLITAGPWKSVSLEMFTSRVANVFVDVDFDPMLGSPSGLSKTEMKNVRVSVTASLDVRGGQDIGSLEVEMSIVAPDQATVLGVTSVKLDINGIATHTFNLENPKLWWPAGLGGQPMYTAITKVRVHQKIVDVVKTRFGVRKIKLVENPIAVSSFVPLDGMDKVGLETQASSTFFFEVNGRPVFCGGANWIPADSFLTRKSSEMTYRNWLTLMVKGNQNMIRVWGGGIYENDIFYDLCDELGLLVWQDFMFACGAYPAHKEFRSQVVEESRHVLQRLRNHPCLAILTGNNEDYAFAESMNLGYDPEDQNEENWLRSGFPARIIYEKDLAKVVKAVCPKVPYKPGSPWGGKTTADTNTGDIHQWNVWHGSQEPYQNYGKLAGRFVSEFGMQGYPVPETFTSFFERGTPTKKMHPMTAVVDHHNKATGFARRIALYLFENLRFQAGSNFEEFIYATQLVQSEALSTAYRTWRREWRGRGQELVGGALVWQINDCWPCVSWAIVDYYWRPKPAYFTVRRELSPLVIGLERDAEKGSVSVWLNNLLDEVNDVTVAVKIHEIETGKLVGESTFVGIQALSNGTTEVANMGLPSMFGEKNKAADTELYPDALSPSATPSVPVVITAYAKSTKTSQVLSRSTSWPQPLRHLPYPLPSPALKIEVDRQSWHDSETGDDHATVTITSTLPVKGVWLYVEGRPAVAPGVMGENAVVFDDNMLDIVPGDEIIVECIGLREEDVVKARWYGDWEGAL